MITIEEKMKLFTQIVYDKVEKYNQNAITNFNTEYGNIIDERKKEFKKEAENIYNQGIKNIQKEKLQILSKARVEEKKIILNQRKKIFQELLNSLRQYAEEFTKSAEYKKVIFSDLNKTLSEMKDCDELEILITKGDAYKFSEELNSLTRSRNIKIQHDNDLVGGFIAVDRKNNVRIDMSIMNRIENSKELIGEKLFAILQ